MTKVANAIPAILRSLALPRAAHTMDGTRSSAGFKPDPENAHLHAPFQISRKRKMPLNSENGWSEEEAVIGQLDDDIGFWVLKSSRTLA